MIYLLEDDSSIRELVCYTLIKTGEKAVGFSNAEDFRHALDEKIPSLAILDIMLPGDDGLYVLKKIRSSPATKNLPVIMLTAKGTEFDKVTALDMGADDYITKPFGVMELTARVKAVLRRSERHDEGEYTLGELYVSIPKHIVSVAGKEVVLTCKEFDLLCYLLDNSGIVVDRDKILNNVWGYSFDGESRTVDVHIRTLRSKLGEGANLIETIRGVGYKIGGASHD